MVVDLRRLSRINADGEFKYWFSSGRIYAHLPRLPVPNPDGWLICTDCGWSALLTQGNIHGGEVGEECKYNCGGNLQRARQSDMDRMYPDGVIDNSSSAIIT